MRLFRFVILGFLLFLFFAPGCVTYNSTNDSDTQSGASYNSLPEVGVPQLRVYAVGFVSIDGQPTLQIASDVVCRSLRFSLKAPGPPQAHLTFELRLIGAKNTTIRNYVSIPYNDCRQSYAYRTKLKVPPGKYLIRLKVTDRSSDDTASRRVRARVPKPNTESSQLGNVRMDVKDDQGWGPVTGYNLPSKVDSLRFTLRASNKLRGDPLLILASLIRYRSDTSIARPFDGEEYDRSSLDFKGIDYDDSTEVRTTRRLLNTPGAVEIQFRFKRPKRGNYRFSVRSDNSGSALFKARVFGVKSLSFPALRTPSELARPLAYIMPPNKYKTLMNVSDSDSMMAAVNHFWKNYASPKHEPTVRGTYYRRVQLANRRYSNFKEGWKTDRGFFYILFGHPLRIGDWRLEGIQDYSGAAAVDREAWEYDIYDKPFYGFFYQAKANTPTFPFDNYLLWRRPGDRLDTTFYFDDSTTPLHYRDNINITIIQLGKKWWLSPGLNGKQLYFMPTRGEGARP